MNVHRGFWQDLKRRKICWRWQHAIHHQWKRCASPLKCSVHLHLFIYAYKASPCSLTPAQVTHVWKEQEVDTGYDLEESAQALRKASANDDDLLDPKGDDRLERLRAEGSISRCGSWWNMSRTRSNLRFKVLKHKVMAKANDEAITVEQFVTYVEQFLHQS